MLDDLVPQDPSRGYYVRTVIRVYSTTGASWRCRPTTCLRLIRPLEMTQGRQHAHLNRGLVNGGNAGTQGNPDKPLADGVSAGSGCVAL